MSDFEWIEQHDINPWFEYDAILFDIEPTKEDVTKYINMALQTLEFGNRDAWEGSLSSDSEYLIDVFRERGFSYIRMTEFDNLLQGYDVSNLRDNNVIKYSDLVGNQLMESDEWDWAREIPDSIPFNELEADKKYKYVPNQNFYGAVESCGMGDKISDWITYVKVMITLYDESEKIPYNDIYCRHKRQDRVSHVVLRIYDDEGNNIRFAVTEDMGEFYPLSEQSLKDLLKLDLNESDDDGFEWAREIQFNPWDMYDSIDFDIVPTDEEVNHYIELALQTREITNRSAWGTGRKFDINEIKSYSRDEDCELTIDEHGALVYGLKENVKHIVNKIKYSELKPFNINESDDDGLDWIREIDPKPRIEVDRDYDVHNDYIYEFLEAVELSGLDIRWNSGDQPTTHYPIEDDRGSTVINIGNDHRLSYWSDYGNRDRTNLIKWPNIDHTITESDDFDWIRDTNPEDIDTITFFQQGKCYYMGKLINKDLGCIKFEKYDPKDTAHSYEDGRGLLQFGTYWYSPLFIEEKLKEKNLTLYDLETKENISNLMESDEMDWIRNTEIPIQPGTIYKSSDEQTLRKILQLIEDKFPKATWMSGSKPTGFFPTLLDDYFGRRSKITPIIVFRDDYRIYFGTDNGLDTDKINYQIIEL